MGQQQLLLIVLALIIIGIAIAISIQLFRENAISSKRDMLINECNTLGSMAIGYYKRPKAFNGGGNSFVGFEVPKEMEFTINGNYLAADITDDQIVITGTGSEVVTGNDSIKVKVTVQKNSLVTEIIN